MKLILNADNSVEYDLCDDLVELLLEIEDERIVEKHFDAIRRVDDDDITLKILTMSRWELDQR